MLKLSTLDAGLRDRIQNQIRDEDRAKANLAPDNPGVRPAAPQPDQRAALVATAETEKAHWYLSAKRFEITFRVYSVRPADYDGIDIKALQDFLADATIIPNDKWNVLSGRVLSCKAATAQDEKTEIEIVAYE